MASSALAILLSAKDNASPVFKKAQQELGGWKAAAAVAGAAATSMAGAMADLTREGQADAAAMEAVKQAVGNAADQLDTTSSALAANRAALAGAQEYLVSNQQATEILENKLRDLDKALRAETGTSKEAQAAKAALTQEIKAAERGLDDLSKGYVKVAKDIDPLTAGIARSEGQLRSQGISSQEATAQLDSYMTKMRDTAAIDDGVLKPALASLIAVTGDYQKSMELAGLAADIARGKNMSLATASELLGKVAMGNTSVLKRYGITLSENATAEEALAELQKKFAGQAETYAQTSQGQLEILSLKLGDFREEIGQSLDSISPFIGLLPGLSAGYSAVGAAVGVVTKAYGANTIANIAHKVASAATVAATVAMTAAQWLLNAALTANPIGIVVVALAALAAAVLWAYQNVDWFREGVDKAFGFLQTAVPAAITIAGGAIGWLSDRLGDAIGRIRDLIDWLGKLPGVQGAGALLGDIGGVIPGFAAGGIVPGPIGSPRLAVVHGGESITPAGGPGGVNVYVTVQGSVTAERDLAEIIRRELISIGRSNVSVGLA